MLDKTFVPLLYRVLRELLVHGAASAEATAQQLELHRRTFTRRLQARGMTFVNPDAVLRPGQFVRVRISGAVRPNAILVPQQAVLQGARGHFVVVVDKDNKAALRPVEVGPWHGNDWFILAGLKAGELVVTDGVVHLTPGAKVKITKTLEPGGEGVPGTTALQAERPAAADAGADRNVAASADMKK